jgi:N-acetyl-1-D-myo-inositol-2-amino-2-deoxy-alpha-D-glucopyranoside deacetylase
VTRRRLLLVHAHPDDETINTGAIMAYYRARDVEVTLLTCTLGEEGEILVPELAALRADAADQLGGYRIGELAAAMHALGVTDHRFLGGAGCFRDSGMLGSPANRHPRAFWRADADPSVFAAAVDYAAAVVSEVRPHVVVTYDPLGGYGHPDHVMAHRVTTAAVAAAAGTWAVPKVYWTAWPASEFTAGNAAARAAAELPFTVADDRQRQGVVADDHVSAVVDAAEFRDAKRVALSAHRTQVIVDGDFFALSNLVARRISGVEHFRLAAGERGKLGDDGRERDLFAGIEP